MNQSTMAQMTATTTSGHTLLMRNVPLPRRSSVGGRDLVLLSFCEEQCTTAIGRKEGQRHDERIEAGRAARQRP